MTSDPIINQVDEEFSLKLTKLIKNYVIDLVNHEVDVITDSDWFTEKIQNAVKDSTDNYEPTDEEMMSSFGTKWHDAL
tara:strand:+ start:4403 stop:4636 length:234 start_codon:yes stop_codon:yes gene_type:complete